MEKYEDLIISIIKKHRKYQEYEDLLDAIVSDVKEHAQAAVSSVTDESVLETYLTKTVATSMVTVPKRLGYQRQKISRPLISEQPHEVSAVEDYSDETLLEQLNDEENQKNTEIEFELNDEVELNETGPVAEDISELEENSDIDSTVNLQESADIDEISLDSEDIQDTNSAEDFYSDEIQSDDVFEQNDSVELSETQESKPELDISLVDKMINGVPSESDLETETVNEIFIPEIDDEGASLTAGNEEITGLSEDSESEEDFVIDLEQSESDGEAEQFADSDLTDELENSDFEELSSDDIILEDNSLESINQEEALEDLLSAENDDLTFDLPSVDADESIESEGSINISADTLDESESNEEVITETASTENSNPNESLYKLLCFEPLDEEDDFDLIEDELISYSGKHPEKMISKICDMKFKNNFSVKEISEKLNKPESEILETLNEIVNIVKD